jgi:hypothetical protein
MNYNRIIWISLLCLGFSAIATPVHAIDQIIEVRGSVSIKRHNQSTYQSVSVGAILNFGDLIRPATGAWVKVRCANGSFWAVPAGTESGLGLGAGCPESVPAPPRSLDSRGGEGINDFLAFLNQAFVPSTRILSPTPLLRWAAIPDATEYRIQVRENVSYTFPLEYRLLWKTSTSEPIAQYQGEPLQIGQDYQLVIETITDSGTATTKLIFRVITPEQTIAITTTRDRLASQDLSNEAKAIALAALYQQVAQPNTDPPADRGLLLEALPPLEALVAAGNQTPYIHRSLGDMYLQLGWYDLAQSRYQRTIELAQSEGDRQNWSTAQVGLACIAAERQDFVRARSLLEGAKIGYELLEDGEQVARIEQWIEKLAQSHQ